MKSDTQNKLSGREAAGPLAEDVAQYLAQHPDFFVGRDELLADLSLPHESGKAISLLERQVMLLRERNADLKRQINEFVDNAHVNDSLFEKTRIIVLELLKAGSLEELAAILEREIGENFGAAESKLLFITDEDGRFPTPTRRSWDEARENLGELFEKKRTFCGDLDDRQSAFLFPGAQKQIVSSAIVPIHISAEEATAVDFSAIPVLAIGSDTPQHFNNRQDTLFLDFIGEVLSALITRLR